MTRVLVVSHDVIGSRMAGPGIRYWEFARGLAPDHEVTLAVPGGTDLEPERFAVTAYGDVRLGALVAGHDVVLTQLLTPSLALAASRYGARIVIDAYDPLVLEGLEQHAHRSAREQRVLGQRMLAKTRLALAGADAVICASERQRDLWLGALMALGQLTPARYAQDPTLRELVEVVPFGLPAEPPVRRGPGLRRQLGIPDGDRVLLWGGGIWSWLDAVTAIRATAELRRHRDDVHLVFLGTRRPNAGAHVSTAVEEAVEEASRLGVLGAGVVFNDGWVPYDQRADFLLDADLGVSTHRQHAETQFAFRTRLLDCLWAGLPVVSTEGDALADLLALNGAGTTVPPEDPEALAHAVARLLDDDDARRTAAQAVDRLKDDFSWPRVIEPLSRLVATVGAAPARRSTGASAARLAELYRTTAREVAQEKGVGYVARKGLRTVLGRARW